MIESNATTATDRVFRNVVPFPLPVPHFHDSVFFFTEGTKLVQLDRIYFASKESRT